jgi:hypothetical protein
VFFRAEKSSKLLLTVFDSLRNLSEGNYLLQSSGRNILLLKEPAPGDTIECHLHRELKNAPTTDLHVENECITTRWKPKPDQIPETFPIDPTKTTEIANICLNYTKFQFCSQENCDKYHASWDILTNPHFKTEGRRVNAHGVKFCHQFASHRFCRTLKVRNNHLVK